jgi:hypothetical protein
MTAAADPYEGATMPENHDVVPLTPEDTEHAWALAKAIVASALADDEWSADIDSTTAGLLRSIGDDIGGPLPDYDSPHAVIEELHHRAARAVAVAAALVYVIGDVTRAAERDGFDIDTLAVLLSSPYLLPDMEEPTRTPPGSAAPSPPNQ